MKAIAAHPDHIDWWYVGESGEQILATPGDCRKYAAATHLLHTQRKEDSGLPRGVRILSSQHTTTYPTV